MESTCIRILADHEQIKACKQRLGEVQASVGALASVLALAGNEVRLKILFLLREQGELCPCDLSDILGMTVPAVSQHLRKLKDGGLVTTRKDGQIIFYTRTERDLDVLQPLFAHIVGNHQKLEII